MVPCAYAQHLQLQHSSPALAPPNPKKEAGTSRQVHRARVIAWYQFLPSHYLLLILPTSVCTAICYLLPMIAPSPALGLMLCA